MKSISKEALEECQRQLDKWDIQDHHPVIWNSILMEEIGDAIPGMYSGHMRISPYHG